MGFCFYAHVWSRFYNYGTPLGGRRAPPLFVLGVEILAQKIRQCKSCRGVQLSQSVKAKINQFVDDTALICRELNALRENMNVLNKFNDISGQTRFPTLSRTN